MQNQKIDYLQLFYGKDAKKWENENDDRRLFSNMYYQIIQALESLEDNDNVYISCAMNVSISRDEKVLSKIQRRFK